MDPNRNLADQLAAARDLLKILDAADQDAGTFAPGQLQTVATLAFELAERVEALDQWIRKSGALPKRWNRK